MRGRKSETERTGLGRIELVIWRRAQTSEKEQWRSVTGRRVLPPFSLAEGLARLAREAELGKRDRATATVAIVEGDGRVEWRGVEPRRAKERTLPPTQQAEIAATLHAGPFRVTVTREGPFRLYLHAEQLRGEPRRSSRWLPNLQRGQPVRVVWNFREAGDHQTLYSVADYYFLRLSDEGETALAAVRTVDLQEDLW